VTKPGRGPWFNSDIDVSPNAKSVLAKLLMTVPRVCRIEFWCLLNTSILARLFRLWLSALQDRVTLGSALIQPWLLEASKASGVCIVQVHSLKSLTSPHLTSFIRASRLCRAIDRMMAEHLVDQQLVDFFILRFEGFDKNSDGLVSHAEFRATVSAVPGYSSEYSGRIDEVFHAIDADGDGFFDYEDIMLAWVHVMVCSKDERLFQAFNILDSNCDGLISRQDLLPRCEYQFCFCFIDGKDIF
jgi:Ca2+-binding EF-hand superfamily protein